MSSIPIGPQIIGNLTSSEVITRYEGNPILTADNVPYPASLIFNAGVTKYEGRYVMVFRNDYFSEDGCASSFQHTNLGLATSEDGLRWTVSPKPCLSWEDDEVYRVYDPRLSVIEGKCYVCFAADTKHGIRAGIMETTDFETFKLITLTTPDNRNMVLFPERINGSYVRMERPFPVYGRGGNHFFDIWISDSPDMRYWGNSRLLLGAEQVPFANDKIGPAAPPIRTSHGWLTTFHAVDIDPSRGKHGWEENWQKRYTAGIMLLNLEDPYRIIGMSKHPLIAPETHYETRGGFRDNVIFSGGMILEDSGEVKIYYGAADAVECLATADVTDLLNLCKPI